jgi:glycosyltransferase involved in cell wall biosynthesis
MPDQKQDIMILMPYDLSTVQGSTAVYHMAKGISKQHNVHLFSKSKPDFKVSSYHPLPDTQSTLLPSLIIYNLLLLPKALYFYLLYSPNIIYSYKGVLLPPYILSLVFKSSWILDLRTPPLEQQVERRKENGNWGFFAIAYFRLYKELYKRTLPQTGHIITLSEGVKDILTSDYNVRGNRITVIPLGVDTERFRPRGIDDKENGKKCTRIVYIGVIKRYREFDVVLQSLSKLPSTENIELHIIGKGDDIYIKEMKKLSSKLGISDVICWHGYIDHKKIPEKLSTMDVGLSPLPPDESYQVSCPANVIEYLATGLPVICTDITPHRDIFEEGHTGFFYEAGDIHQLGNKINTIQNMDRKQKLLSKQQARNGAMEYDWSNILDDVEDIIFDLVK